MNEALNIAISAMVMAGLIGLSILLRYLLRRGRQDTVTVAPREVANIRADHSWRRTLSAAQELEAAILTAIKKEPVTPHSCHRTLAAAQELHHLQAAIKKEPATICSCHRTLSMPALSPRKDPYLREELIVP